MAGLSVRAEQWQRLNYTFLAGGVYELQVMVSDHMSGAPERSAEQAPRTAPCILVVEDEVLVRLDIAEELRLSGFHVLEAQSADEALEILRSGAQVDAVFSDVRMPGSLDGMGLALVIAEHLSHVSVVLTSGHAEALVGPARAMGVQLLSKPYEPDDVVAAINRELRRSDDE